MTLWKLSGRLASLRCMREFTCQLPASFPESVTGRWSLCMCDFTMQCRKYWVQLGNVILPATGTPFSWGVTHTLTEWSKGTLRSFQNWLWKLAPVLPLPIKVAQWRQRLRFYSVYLFIYVWTCVSSVCTCVSVWSMYTVACGGQKRNQKPLELEL